MTDFLGKIAFLERRLTSLERELRALRIINPNLLYPSLEGQFRIDCDAPGLITSQAYGLEGERANAIYCWVGSEESIQLILPVAPITAFTCSLIIAPHEKVSIEKLRLFVNDVFTPYQALNSADQTVIVFSVMQSGRPYIEINFVGLKSIRPIDLGENEDTRWLAFKFFRADIQRVFEGLVVDGVSQ